MFWNSNKRTIWTLIEWPRSKNFGLSTIFQTLQSLDRRCSTYLQTKPILLTYQMNEKFFILKPMVLLSDPELRKFLRTSDDNIVLVLCECFYNVIRGHKEVQINNLEQYDNVIKTVLRKNVSVEKKRAILLTKTGFDLVRLIILFCYQYLSQS